MDDGDEYNDDYTDDKKSARRRRRYHRSFHASVHSLGEPVCKHACGHACRDIEMHVDMVAVSVWKALVQTLQVLATVPCVIRNDGDLRAGDAAPLNDGQ